MNKVVSGALAALSLFWVVPAFAYGPTDLAHLHPGTSARPPIGWVQFCSQFPAECSTPLPTGRIVVLTPQRWRELDSVNRFFNKAIEPVTDQDQYGVVERWTYATTGKGDCEDYVLEKRRRLVQLGWPASALLITVVIDKQNGGHAVLTAVTDRGELVLDNVVDEILPWSQSGLTFVKRQSPRDPNMWVDLGHMLGMPDVVTAATRR